MKGGALYRKYRPKTLEDVLGEEHITQTLKNAAISDKISHAYLFYGSRGTGKTTIARILAKILNCETRQKDKKFSATGEPCNKCLACTEIDLGRSLDVVEIDAASNRGIDEIRDLKDSIKLSPSSLKYKIFIIDEVHQLTKEAFNALLKTLEEPPAHAVFILATTEYEKVPSTIISRTQRFNFRKIPIVNIIEKLKIISKEEKISIEDEALELIAESAEGGLRDAESILDQIRSFDKKITVSEVENMLGKAGFKKIFHFAELLTKKDTKGSLEFINAIYNEGFSIVDVTKELIHFLRKTLSLKADPNFEKIFEKELTQSEITKLKELAKIADEKLLISLIRGLIKAYSEMRYSPFSYIPLEVAVVEILKN